MPQVELVELIQWILGGLGVGVVAVCGTFITVCKWMVHRLFSDELDAKGRAKGWITSVHQDVIGKIWDTHESAATHSTLLKETADNMSHVKSGVDQVINHLQGITLKLSKLEEKECAIQEEIRAVKDEVRKVMREVQTSGVGPT